MTNLFRNRAHAGQLLASLLEKYSDRPDVIVLGLPRGGVPVAFEVARKLNAPLDVFVVRKLGVPEHRELAMGAIATGGVCVLNRNVMETLGLSQLTLDAVAAEEQKELARRELLYRGRKAAPRLGGKTVILVDDGIATGSTMRAAVRAIRLQGPACVVVAIPVCALSAFDDFRNEADEVIALMTPENFYSVGQWYQDFSQTEDEEVTELLAASRSSAAAKEEKEAPFLRMTRHATETT